MTKRKNKFSARSPTGGQRLSAGRTVQIALTVTGLWIALIARAPLANAAGLDLSQFTGKVVYLDFWASWCVPCRQSFPWLNEVQAAYANKGLVVIGVDLDKEPELARKFIDAHRPSFPLVSDPEGSIARSYNVKAMPTSLVIGRDGQVHAVHQGFHPEQEFEYVSHIEAALRERAQ